MLQTEPHAASLSDDAARTRPGDDQVCACGLDGRPSDVHPHLERLRVELHHELALAHAVVVVDENAHDLTRDSRGDEGHVAVHVRVVRDTVRHAVIAMGTIFTSATMRPTATMGQRYRLRAPAIVDSIGVLGRRRRR